jgi:nucleoid-associated protein YgaU
VTAIHETGGCYGDGTHECYASRQDLHRKIFEANKDVIENPDLLEVGQDLIIPE